MTEKFSMRLLVCLSIALASALPLRAACGSPTFSELPSIAAEHDVAELALGDLDGDGEVDLVTVSSTAGNINVRLGNGDGSFGNELTYTAPSPTEITLGDLDGDHFLDILVASEPPQTPDCVAFGSCAGFSVLLNDGDGTFGTATTTPVPYAASIVSIDTADFTADGKLDVLVAAPPLTSSDPDLHAFFGDGDGEFSVNHSWSVDGPILSAVGATLTLGTGQADVAALVGPGTSSTSTRMLVFESKGGTFPSISATRNITTVTSPSASLITADMNGNGKDDLVFTFRWMTNPDGWGAGYILTNGPTSLSNAGYYAETGPDLLSIAAEDVDEDGDLDVMLPMYGDGWKAYRRNAAGNFEYPTAPATGSFTTGGSMVRVITNDFNHDGRPDFFFLDAGNDAVAVLENSCVNRYVKVTLSSSPNPSLPDSDVVFTINAQQKAGAPTPQGTVTLYEGETILGSATLNGSGNAFITLSNLPVGTHSLTAQLASTNEFASAVSNTYQHTVSLPPFGPPPNMTATGNAAANKITIRWQQTAETVSYEVRRLTNGTWMTIGSTGGDSFVDVNVSNSSAYAYSVRAHRTNGEISYPSLNDIGTTAVVLLPADKKIRATDFTTTRTLVNSLRTAAGLSAYTFTDPSLTGVAVKSVHVTELREALNGALVHLVIPERTFTNPTLTPGTTPVRAIDIQEIRNSLQ